MADHAAGNAGGAFLEVEDLSVEFAFEGGAFQALRGVSFSIEEGRTLGVVGESGCGKSITARAIMGLIPPPGRISSGRIAFRGRKGACDLARLAPMGPEMRAIRGNEIAMIFQEPMTSLNPAHRIGRQIAEPLRLHLGLGSAEARRRAVEMLAAVGIPAPETRAEDYPHQLSGGMRQRAMIAMALSCDPRLLIADEPTTALDVTIQAQVLALINALRARHNSAVMFITHDLGVIAQMADDVIVMYLGRVVERAPVARLFSRPSHPYTIGLMHSMPSMALRKGTRLQPIDGTVPGPREVTRGCGFASRCPHVMARCRIEHPPLTRQGAGHESACWLHAMEAEAGVAP